MHLRRICLFSLVLLVSVYLPAAGAEQPPAAAGAAAAAPTGTSDAGAAKAGAAATAGTSEQQPAVAPQAENSAEQEPASKDVVLVLDNSGSMRKNDPDFLTKTAVTDFIEHLDANTRVAIEIFDQTVRIAVPFTFVTDSNRTQILKSLKQINYKGKLTDSPSAIERAIYELKNDGRADARKMIVFMTDGIVDTGNPTTSAEKSRWLQDELAPAAADAGIKIFGIAFTEEADFQLIQTLAQKTHGDYFRALAPGDLKGVFEHINTEINRRPKPKPKPAPKAPPPPPPPPIIVHVPAQPAVGVAQQEQLHSIILIVAVIVMMVTLIAIIYLLVRRGRQMSGPDDQYVVEAYLNDLSGNTSQSTYKLGRKPTMLGRVEGQDHEHLNYIVIPQSTVGRRHALIDYKDFGYWIADQGSINGTFVNNKAISSEVRLKHGDRVRLHKFEFEFVMPEMSDAGMTVVSNTVFAGEGGADAEATVMKGEAGAEVPVPVPEPDFDIGIEGTPEAAESDEEDTVLSGSGEPAPSEDFSSEDETLLPGSEAPASSDAAAGPTADDETLMPGHAPGGQSEPEFSTDDETLMPSGPEPGRASRKSKSGGGEDFFDITGAAKDDDRH